VVFNEGEEDHSAIYLLQGEVELVTGSNVLKVLRGGDEATVATRRPSTRSRRTNRARSPPRRKPSSHCCASRATCSTPS
jgi:hypothetical protein